MRIFKIDNRGGQYMSITGTVIKVDCSAIAIDDMMYMENSYDRFLINLSWSDLSYRYETRKLIERIDVPERNEYVDSFMDQFRSLDTDHKACFLFPENFVSQFFVIMEVCKKTESFHPIRPIFPDEEKVH